MPRTTIEDMMLVLGISSEEVQTLVQDVRSEYNLNRIIVGHRFAIETSESGSLRSFDYDISDEEYLSVRPESGQFKVARHRYDLEVVVEEFYGSIERSLWQTIIDGGETARLVYKLTQILQWDIDFTSIQRGDDFKLIVEKKYRGGEFVKYGEIFGVEFNSGGRSFFGFRFENAETGKTRYYDEKGYLVRKTLLKVPFDFDPRITSSFSFSRYHPILRRRRPHLGVDYGAPRGTPVLASGSGIVIKAGTQGGYGKLVRIRHPNGYVTSYAHLSRIEVRRGRKVNQGQRIGRVGSTGLSTGPHLDYRVQDGNGRYVNPQNVSALPSDGPVDPRFWEDFVEVRDGLRQGLASIPQVGAFLRRTQIAD